MKSIISSANGGTKYSALTAKQKKKVRKWYGREMVAGEKKYSYFFKDGECDSAS